MTYENNLIRIEEARKRGNEEEALFWEERNKRKYPDKIQTPSKPNEEEVANPDGGTTKKEKNKKRNNQSA